MKEDVMKEKWFLEMLELIRVTEARGRAIAERIASGLGGAPVGMPWPLDDRDCLDFVESEDPTDVLDLAIICNAAACARWKELRERGLTPART